MAGPPAQAILPSFHPSHGRIWDGLVTLGFGLALFGPGLGLHEALHLAVLHGLGGDGALIVRPWRFALVDLTLPSLHVQPVPPLDSGRQLAVNFLGPALAAAALTLALIPVRDRRLRLAAMANVAVLGFYALIEVADLVTDSIPNPATAALITPEFNYGVPLATFLAVAFLGAAARQGPYTGQIRRD